MNFANKFEIVLTDRDIRAGRKTMDFKYSERKLMICGPKTHHRNFFFQSEVNRLDSKIMTEKDNG